MGSAIVTYEQEIYANATMHDASAASNEACQARERYGPSFRPVKPGPCYAAGITFEDAADVIRRGLGVGPESFSEGLTQESSLRPQLNQLAE